MSHDMLNTSHENKPLESIIDADEDLSRVNTPTPMSHTGPRPKHLRTPATVPPNDGAVHSRSDDSGDDTEPEEALTDPQPSLIAFSSFLSYRTAATSPGSSTQQLHPSPAAPSTLEIRRSVSVDRLTMRPTRVGATPPLLRTQSQRPISSPLSCMDDSRLQSALLSAPLESRYARSNNVLDINSVLNAFCGDHAYLNQQDGPVYGSDTESNEDRQESKRGHDSFKSTPDERSERFASRDKGKGRADVNPGLIRNSEQPSPSDALPSPSKRSAAGSNENTDDEKYYNPISGDVSDSEDIDISAHIPTLAPLPPFPAPTVSRSRSSSRSYPSSALTNVPPVPPLPPFALLSGRARALSSPRILSGSLSYSPVSDNRSLQTPTPTQSLSATSPPTPSTASITSSTSFLSSTPDRGNSGPLQSSTPPSASRSHPKSRKRSVSESGGGSGSGSNSQSRGRFVQSLTNALRKSPSPSPGRGIEHIKPAAGKPKERPRFTIAFIGSSGCGKTTIIDKASKLSNAKFKQEVSRKNVCYGSEEITIELRDAAVVVDKSRNTCPINTIELDSAPFIKALNSGSEFWPESLPHIDGVVLCYDASKQGNETGSFKYVRQLNDAFAALRHPIIWVACKSDWVRQPKKDSTDSAPPRVLPDGIVSPQEVFVKAAEARTGLIEVTKNSTDGKEQMRNLMTWMYKAVGRMRREKQLAGPGEEYLNHASPEVLDRKPSQKSSRRAPVDAVAPPPASRKSDNTQPNTPISPTSLVPPQRPASRARSMSDLLSQAARDRVTETSAAVLRKASATVSATTLPRNTVEHNDAQKDPEQRSQSGDGTLHKNSEHNTSVLVLHPKLKIDPFAFLTLDQLINRLSGGFCPGYDIRFNEDFMLTFRRFSTPRAVLLAIIRRLRIVEDEDEMRRAVLVLCDYLLDWTRLYPSDFAVPGAIAPLEALIRMMRDEHSHEGALVLEQRLEFLQKTTDEDSDWAKPISDFTEGDDSDNEHDPDSRPHSSELNPVSPVASVEVSVSTSVAVTTVTETVTADGKPSEEAPTLRPESIFLNRNSTSPVPPLLLPEQDEKELRKLAKSMLDMNPEHVAEEITREDLRVFLAIRPRDWMRHAYTLRRDRDPAVHPLDEIAHRFERIGHLVASFILIFNKRRRRAQMFEFWIKVAITLRSLNNFAALHTVIAAMDKVFSGDDGPQIEDFVQAGDLNWNKWLSMRVLILKSNGGAYKTALKHTTQPLIPTMAIHTSDIVRVMSNRDYKENNPNLIHWGKFQIIARIATSMSELQKRLRLSNNYEFRAHTTIAQLLKDAKPMSEEMIIEKTFPAPGDSPPPKPGVWTVRVMRMVLG